MYIVHYNKKKYLLPEKYNELSGKQLVAIAGIQNSKDTAEVQAMQALRVLLNVGLFRFFMVHNDAKQRMLQLMEWVFERNTLTEQLLPKYKGYHGARREFENMTMAEFHLCELFYHELVVEKEPEALNKLVAVLYRRPKDGYNAELDSDGDVRVKFNANEVDYHSRKIAKWNENVKLAILFFYDGCRQHLLGMYDRVFSGGGNESSNNNEGMFGVIRGIADGGKYGDFYKIEEMNVHTALMEMEKCIEEQEAAEMRMKM